MCAEISVDEKNGSSSSRRRRPWGGLIIILMVLVGVSVVFTHRRALSAKATSFDDEQYLHKNELVQNPSLESAWRFLSEVLNPSTVHGYYQPLTMISLMLDYAAGGRTNNLAVFHITSLSLHVINTLLIIVLLYMLFGKLWPAVFVGFLFGLHPMTVEPIPWVSERKTLLASFFGLWCLIIYVRYARKGSVRLFLACVMTYILALMAKPTITPLALLLFLLDFWPLNRLNKKTLLEKVPFFVIMIAFGIITVISQSRTASVTMPSEYNPNLIPMVLCHNIIFYLYKIILPVGLTSHYPIPEPLSLLHPMIQVGLIGTCILLPVLIISLRWIRALFTGWLFFFLAALPTMGIIGFTNVIASDKYAYFPSVGLLMVLCWALCKIWRGAKDSGFYRLIILFMVGMLGFLESSATRSYLLKWQESEQLFRYMLIQAPKASPLHLNLGNTLLKSGRTQEAIKHYKKATSFNPGFALARYNLGVALMEAGNYDKAIKEFRVALKLGWKRADSLFRIGIAFARKGDVDKAIHCYKMALEKRPNNFKILNNLGLALAKKSKTDEAIQKYQQCLELNPNSTEVLTNTGNALSDKKDFKQAITYYEKALRIDANFSEAHYNLANALVKTGEIKQAASHYQQSLRLEPNNVDAYFGLGIAMEHSGEYDKADEYYHKAIQLNPDFGKAHYRLGLIFYKHYKNIDKAIEHFREVLSIHPKDADMHCNLGTLLAQKGKISEAVEEFKEALRINPNHSRAQKQLDIYSEGSNKGPFE